MFITEIYLSELHCSLLSSYDLSLGFLDPLNELKYGIKEATFFF